ncbi:PPE family protein, partial [Mycobacterium riyadhense]
MDFTGLPPEHNSGQMFAGAGPGPMLVAAAAWQGLAVELGSSAVAFASLTSRLATSSWQGPASAAMVGAAEPYVGWLSDAAMQAEQAAAQARLAAAAFEVAQAATVHPAIIAANRARFVWLAASNLLGQNAPAIAAAEAEYEQMWAQDVAAMFDYHADASAIVSVLSPFTGVPQNLAGPHASVAPAAEAVVHPPSGPGLNLGLANVGRGNIGNGNIGNFNLGSGNVGSRNIGSGNIGSGNIGFGNTGPSMAAATAAARNFGFGNTGSGNIGFGNTG